MSGEDGADGSFADLFKKWAEQVEAGTLTEAGLAERIRVKHPEIGSKLARYKRDGWFLLSMFEHAWKSAFARNDLNEARKAELVEDVRVFYAAFAAIRAAPQGLCSRKTVFEFAMSALLVGMKAGLSPDEIDAIIKRSQRDQQRERANKGAQKRRQKLWMAKAATIAKQIWSQKPSLSAQAVARYVVQHLKSEKDLQLPNEDRVARYVRQLNADGCIPRKKTPA